jgi:hypothetical protein
MFLLSAYSLAGDVMPSFSDIITPKAYIIVIQNNIGKYINCKVVALAEIKRCDGKIQIQDATLEFGPIGANQSVERRMTFDICGEYRNTNYFAIPECKSFD